jgi:hypothetical protein
MMKPAVTVALLATSIFATSASADTVTTEADTLVVVTPNAPVVVQQGGGHALQPPGAAEMPPTAPAAASSAPQNEDWNNVSHINGTPVKVGERGAYLHKFRKTNISGNPFGPFFGYYDLAVSHALTQNLAASVSISGWDMDNSGGYQISATVPLYFRRTYSGPFLEGGLLVRTDMSDTYYAESYDQYGNAYSYETMDTSSSWIGPQLLFGWQSTFDSGLNVALAFGVAKRLESDGDTEANGYFRVGYAF